MSLHPLVRDILARNRARRPHVICPEDRPELTPEQVALYALEEKLAHVRRLLVHARQTRAEAFRPDVRALSSLAEQLHHQVLEEILGGPRE